MHFKRRGQGPGHIFLILALFNDKIKIYQEGYIVSCLGGEPEIFRADKWNIMQWLNTIAAVLNIKSTLINLLKNYQKSKVGLFGNLRNIEVFVHVQETF